MIRVPAWKRIVVHDISFIGQLLARSDYHKTVPQPGWGASQFSRDKLGFQDFALIEARWGKAVGAPWHPFRHPSDFGWLKNDALTVSVMATNDRIRWCDAKCEGDWLLSRSAEFNGYGNHIWFECDEDRVLYKLQWGD